MSLTAEERGVMERAAAEGGCLTIEGLAQGEMVHAASVLLTLQVRGFFITRITFDQTRHPEVITAELTLEGRHALAS